MDENAIQVLQAVKQAEEEKAKAIAEARRQSEERLRSAERTASQVEADVRRRIADEETAERAEVEAHLRGELAALETWDRKKRDALHAAAKANLTETIDVAHRWFLDEWRAAGE